MTCVKVQKDFVHKREIFLTQPISIFPLNTCSLAHSAENAVNQDMIFLVIKS